MQNIKKLYKTHEHGKTGKHAEIDELEEQSNHQLQKIEAEKKKTEEGTEHSKREH